MLQNKAETDCSHLSYTADFPQCVGIAGCLDECSDLKQNSAKGGRIPVLIISKYHCGISLCNGSHLNSMEMKLYVLCL